jgi:hypothetical protein
MGDVEKNERKTTTKKRRRKKKRSKPEPFAKLADLEGDLANENWKTDLSVNHPKTANGLFASFGYGSVPHFSASSSL